LSHSFAFLAHANDYFLYFFRKKIEKAIELFEDYAKTYKLTPGNQLLAYSVLKDKALLERYIKASTSVHGATNVKHQLAYSLSDIGHTHDASKIFTVRVYERKPPAPMFHAQFKSKT